MLVFNPNKNTHKCFAGSGNTMQMFGIMKVALRLLLLKLKRDRSLLFYVFKRKLSLQSSWIQHRVQYPFLDFFFSSWPCLALPQNYRHLPLSKEASFKSTLWQGKYECEQKVCDVLWRTMLIGTSIYMHASASGVVYVYVNTRVNAW